MFWLTADFALVEKIRGCLTQAKPDIGEHLMLAVHVDDQIFPSSSKRPQIDRAVQIEI